MEPPFLFHSYVPFTSLSLSIVQHFRPQNYNPARMAPPSTTSSPGAAKAAARRLSGSRRRTEATPPRKLKPMSEILAKARYAVVEQGDYSDVSCEQCGTGDRDEELLLCDKCDKGFHMKCVRPIVARVPIGSWLCPNCSGHRPVRKLSQKKIIDFFRIQKGTDKKEKLGSPLGFMQPISAQVK